MQTLDQLRQNKFEGVIETLKAMNFGEGEIFIRGVGDVLVEKAQPNSPDSRFRYVVDDYSGTLYVYTPEGEWEEWDYDEWLDN